LAEWHGGRLQRSHYSVGPAGMTTAGQSWNTIQNQRWGLTHAQIASRQLARATVGYEVEADLGTFRERRKASPLDR